MFSIGEKQLGFTVRGTPPAESRRSAPQLGSGHMAFKSGIVGRMEKRLPIAIVVRLTDAQDQPANAAELTYTDNVSAHGARVISKRSWQTGQPAQVTSLKDEITIRGQVVYCQKLPDDRYGIGLKFQDHGVTWPAYSNYNRT